MTTPLHSRAELPSVHDALLNVTGALIDAGQSALSSAKPATLPPLAKDDAAGYDPATRSWAGTNQLRYRVPLMDMPSEAHTKSKVRNIRILMDNVRRMCVNDLLPATEEEKQFWSRYRFVKYQMVLTPFCMAMPVTYAASKLLFNYLPGWIRGRFFPLSVSFMFAEMWSEQTYPAYQFLEMAMRAKTPLGDAARADWQRLQPVTISPTLFASYNFRMMIASPMEELAFGGNVLAVCG